jgi:DNA-binding Lrp family transcriptional regulator
MVSLPEAVKRTLDAIKKEYGSYLEVKLIKGRYCLFDATSVYDKDLGHSKKVTRYLGHMTIDGILIPARHRIEKQVKTQPTTKEEPGEGGNELKESELTLLRYLSMNARAPLSSIGKVVGLSDSAVSYQIKKLERKYGIMYLTEIDVEKLGYVDYMALIKFSSKQPSFKEIREATEKEPMIQLVMTTKGDYDLVIHFLAKIGRKTREGIYSLRAKLFLDYDAEWCITPFYMHYGHIPVRDKFFDILKEDVWIKTKETRRRPEGKITARQLNVLRALNKNGAVDFATIDADCGFDRGASQYTYHQLREKGVIIRSTISMLNLPIKYNMMVLIEGINQKEWEADRIK